MQEAVARAIHSHEQEDPLGEAETSLAPDEHMKGLGFTEEQRQVWLNLFEQREHARTGRSAKELEQEPVEEELEDEVLVQETETDLPRAGTCSEEKGWTSFSAFPGAG